MIYQISSGQGPAECELGAAKFLEYLHKNYEIAVLDVSVREIIQALNEQKSAKEIVLREYNFFPSER